MPYVLEFNKKALGPKWKTLEQIFGQNPLRWVLNLRQSLAIPHTLHEMGVPDEAVELASAATADPSSGTNPEPLSDEVHRQILEDALRGFLKVNQLA